MFRRQVRRCGPGINMGKGPGPSKVLFVIPATDFFSRNNHPVGTMANVLIITHLLPPQILGGGGRQKEAMRRRRQSQRDGYRLEKKIKIKGVRLSEKTADSKTRGGRRGNKGGSLLPCDQVLFFDLPFEDFSFQMEEDDIRFVGFHQPLPAPGAAERSLKSVILLVPAISSFEL